MSVVYVTGPNNFAMSTVHSFTGNLPELLMAMAKDDRILICIAELHNDRYIQFRVSSARTIIEVVSNQFLHDTNALSTKDEEQLKGLGFEEPSSSQYPNWRYEVPNPIDIVQIVNIANSSIASVLHALPGDPVRIKTFEVFSRGKKDELDAT
jgi:hypothetical protein